MKILTSIPGRQFPVLFVYESNKTPDFCFDTFKGKSLSCSKSVQLRVIPKV